MAHSDDVEIHETPTQARAGDRRVWTTRVLVISTIAAAVALGLFLLPSLGG